MVAGSNPADGAARFGTRPPRLVICRGPKGYLGQTTSFTACARRFGVTLRVAEPTNGGPRQEQSGIVASIGPLNEGHLHASLRARYVEPVDKVEVGVDGYIVDILRGDLIIEIQTAHFSAIARRMRDLVSRHRVRLVYPIPRELWIMKLPQDSGEVTRRKSPKHLDVIECSMSW